jgi:hypothetical protein
MNGSFPKNFEVKDAAHGATNQALDFLSATRLFAARCLTIAASMG